MFDPESLFEKATYSRFHKWILNIALDRMVPFNKPHGFKVLEISKQEVTTLIPYKKSNFNHIKGLHATALATLSEFTTGLMLLNVLGTKNYRIILQRLDIEYHYQGKKDAVANYKVDDQWLNENVHKPLERQDSTIVPCKVSIADVSGNELTSATIYWQIKSWEKVKTKL
jgi:hypothetical protein